MAFYQFGVSENLSQQEAIHKKKEAGEAAVVLDSSQEARSHRTTDSPDELTLGGVLADVNGKIAGMPEIVRDGGRVDWAVSEVGKERARLKAREELDGVRACVKALGVSSDEVATGQVKGGVAGVLHNALWGKDIAVPRGSVGKHGSGIAHMQEKRILHGFSVDEAAFIAVCALKAAESVNANGIRGNKHYFERFGVRAVVAEDAESDNPIITGFILDTEGKNKAVDADAALSAQRFYALDELRRVQEVGATMDRALARLEGIIKENPDEWEAFWCSCGGGRRCRSR